MKYISTLKYILLAVSALSVLVYFLFQGPTDVDFMLDWAYVLMGIAVVSALLFPLWNIIQNPQGALRSLIGLIILVVIVGVSYMLASDAVIVTPVNTFSNPLELKASDTGLYVTYVAMATCILSIVVGEVANLFR